MARKKKEEADGPSMAYLMSFGDTMTTLLAFFIVLNSLADEQTGANLHSGTGSFIKAMKSMGLAGAFSDKRTARVLNMEASNPLYVSEDSNPESGSPALGPDDDANNLRVIDREADQLERFLKAMDERHHLNPVDEVAAETVFDLFNAIPDKGPVLVGPYREAVLEIASRAIDPNFQIEFTVWATTPSDSAIRRAAGHALQIQQEFIALLQLSPEHQERLTATARPWFHKKVKRPRVSITLRKK